MWVLKLSLYFKLNFPGDEFGGNRSTYYQRTRQQQSRPTNIIPALNGHGDQQNLGRGVENIAPTPSTPTVASIAARQQQLQQQLQQQQQQQQTAMAAQGKNVSLI
mgnify:CR=1 FL=1